MCVVRSHLFSFRVPLDSFAMPPYQPLAIYSIAPQQNPCKRGIVDPSVTTLPTLLLVLATCYPSRCIASYPTMIRQCLNDAVNTTRGNQTTDDRRRGQQRHQEVAKTREQEQERDGENRSIRSLPPSLLAYFLLVLILPASCTYLIVA